MSTLSVVHVVDEGKKPHMMFDFGVYICFNVILMWIFCIEL